MNFIKHFKSWLTRVEADDRLTSHHISLYDALFFYWNANRFRNPTTIFRHEIMNMSKIGSINTYTKSLRELTEWGYIRYEPSFNPQIGSKVHLFRFDKGGEQSRSKSTAQRTRQARSKASSKAGSKSLEDANSKASGQTDATYYTNNPNILNGINILNNLNGINAHEPNNKISDVIDGGKTNTHSETIHPAGTGGTETEIKTQAPGGRRGATAGSPDKLGATNGSLEKLEACTGTPDQLTATTRRSRQVVPAVREAVPDCVEKVQAYFLELNAPAPEAERFFNYFESNGWKVGGKTPMKDWRAAARNWILNAKNFNHNTHDHTSQPKPGRLNTGPKNYAEPF